MKQFKWIVRSSTILICIFTLSISNTNASDEAVKKNSPIFIVQDSYILGHYFSVFIPDKDFSYEMNPRLHLMNMRNGDLFKTSKVKIYNNHILEDKNERYESASEKYIGSLLLFTIIDSVQIPFYHPTINVEASLLWQSISDTTHQDSSELKNEYLLKNSYILIGNKRGATFWTMVTLIGFLLIVYVLTRKAEHKMLGPLCNKDKMLSMSLLQMALWTITVGFMVFGFALFQAKVPYIPESLLILMGAAAATGTIGYYLTDANRRKNEEVGFWQNEIDKLDNVTPEPTSNEPIPPKKSQWKIYGELINRLFFISKDSKDPSLALSQIFFWTVITLILFIVKSVREDLLWDVPEQFVYLMGISQAAFLARQGQQSNVSKAQLDSKKNEYKEKKGKSTSK